MSEFEYFLRYGNEGTTGRFNSPSTRGNFSNEEYVHTAKNETRSWVTPTPTVTPSITATVTPTISVSTTVTPSISVTPTITLTPTITVTPTITTSLP